MKERYNTTKYENNPFQKYENTPRYNYSKCIYKIQLKNKSSKPKTPNCRLSLESCGIETKTFESAKKMAKSMGYELTFALIRIRSDIVNVTLTSIVIYKRVKECKGQNQNRKIILNKIKIKIKRIIIKNNKTRN